jgi:hypothetical protein
MARAEIPATLDEITPGWLTGVLRARGFLDGAARVAAARLERIGESVGYTGQVARVHLSYDAGGPCAGAPATLIAKLPTTERRARGAAEMLGVYEREIRFYDELAPGFPVRVPRCYFGAMTPGAKPGTDVKIAGLLERLPGRALALFLRFAQWLTGYSRRRFVLLLEDLAPARPGDQVAGCSVETAGEVLSAMATMHAAFWGERGLDQLPWLARVDTAPRLGHTLFRLARPAFDRRYGERLPRDCRALAGWLDRHALALGRALAVRPFTLLHGDPRLDNLFFGAAGTTFADWQSLARGPAMYDVAYFLTATLAPSARPEDEIDLLRTYHRRLVGAGVEHYDFAGCQLDYERARLLMLARLISVGDTIEFETPRARSLIEGWIERLTTRLVGVDPDRLLPAPVSP